MQDSTVLGQDVLAEIDEVIRRGEIRSARKRIEQERRRLLQWGDTEGLRKLAFPAGCLGPRGEDLAYAIRQNIRQLERDAYGEPAGPTLGPRGNLVRAVGVWFALWPVLTVGYPFFAAAGGGQTMHGLVVFGIVLAVGWLLPLAVILVSWRRGKTDLVHPLLGWALLPFMAGLLFIPYLWRGVRRELRLRPRY